MRILRIAALLMPLLTVPPISGAQTPVPDSTAAEPPTRTMTGTVLSVHEKAGEIIVQAADGKSIKICNVFPYVGEISEYLAVTVRGADFAARLRNVAHFRQGDSVKIFYREGRALIDSMLVTPSSELGVTAELVRKAQMRLDEFGYAAGPADGLLGPETRTALGAYQRDHGIPQTALLDGPTLEALLGYGAQPQSGGSAPEGSGSQPGDNGSGSEASRPTPGAGGSGSQVGAGAAPASVAVVAAIDAVVHAAGEATLEVRNAVVDTAYDFAAEQAPEAKDIAPSEWIGVALFFGSDWGRAGGIEFRGGMIGHCQRFPLYVREGTRARVAGQVYAHTNGAWLAAPD